jgi:HK97 family phage prohead protease
MTIVDRPTAGSVEQRSAAEAAAAPAVDGRRLHGLIPYGVESRDLGGFREIIDAGALTGADLSDLIATREHDRAHLLGRHPTTLTTEDRADGFAWSVELPQSPVGEDVRVAVERGDLRSTSWRMVVGRDRWDGDVRHIEQISELRDVTVTAAPAYGEARAEYRSAPFNGQEANMSENTATEATEENTETTETVEDRATPPANTGGGLRVEDRVTVGTTRGLAEELRNRGFPGETATIEFGELRAATFTGATDTLSPVRNQGVALGDDSRYAYPAFPNVSVDAGVTSVQVFRQSGRTLPAAANVIRAITAVTPKPEVGSALEIVTLALNQVAGVQTGIPNIYTEQPIFNSVIEGDLRLSLNAGLDKLVLDAVAGSGFQAPGTDPLLVSIRKAITVVQANGYSPNVLVVRPSDAELLDTLRATQTAGEEMYVFAAGGLAPRNLFGLQVRIAKDAAAPFIADSAAFGKLYISPIALSRHEENAGSTNTSTVRLEGHSAFGVERAAAAVRIAAA